MTDVNTVCVSCLAGAAKTITDYIEQEAARISKNPDCEQDFADANLLRRMVRAIKAGHHLSGESMWYGVGDGDE